MNFIKLPNRQKPSVLHVNLLKKWHTPTHRIHRINVFTTDGTGNGVVLKDHLVLARDDYQPTSEEQQCYRKTSTNLCVSDDSGRTDKTSFNIRTDDMHQSGRTHRAYPQNGMRDTM